MNRRRFIQSLGLASVAAGCCAPIYAQRLQSPQQHRTKYLVLLELKGGNDSLNTIVPFRDPAYKALRPSIAISADQLLPLNDNQGLHTSLPTVKSLFDKGEVAIVQNVGYERPNFSHFSSIDIWESASHRAGDGWLHQLFARNPSIAGIVDGIVFGGSSGFFRGDNARFLVTKSIDKFMQGSQKLNPSQAYSTDHNPILAFFHHNKSTIMRTSNVLQKAVEQATPIKTVFPETDIGKQFLDAATVISSGFDTPVIKISLPGFDTHVDQLVMHASLLQDFDDALNAFRQSLHTLDLWGDVLLMSYSEFGRRAKENGNVGTDHGAAGCQFIIGQQCRGGLFGEPPRLDQLQNDNVVHQLDFRQIYLTLENQWFDVGTNVIDKGVYAPLDFLKS